jgi:hypothetical protein
MDGRDKPGHDEFSRDESFFSVSLWLCVNPFFFYEEG